MTTVKVGMKVGSEHRESRFRAREGEKSGFEHKEGHFRAREGEKLIPEAEGRQGLQTRTPSSDGEPLPRGEGFGVGVT